MDIHRAILISDQGSMEGADKMKEGSKLFKALTRDLKESFGMTNECIMANHYGCSVKTAQNFLRDYAVKEVQCNMTYYYCK